MPFGISSAPEVFQRKMHEFAEGLAGIEVVADDFLVVGFGDSYEEAARDHDKNLLAFLKRCEEQDIHLNAEKMKLRKDEVLFIGHLASAQGLRVDPDKVCAITEMPRPSEFNNCLVLHGTQRSFCPTSPSLCEISHKMMCISSGRMLRMKPSRS